MAEIWMLAIEPGADVGLLTYAFDAHFSALFHQAVPESTLETMYTAQLEPNGLNATVYSHMHIPDEVSRLAHSTQIAHPPVSVYRGKPHNEPESATESERLFSQAGAGCKSVRYVSVRLMACLKKPRCAIVARHVAASFMLGAYAHARPADICTRGLIYASPCIVAELCRSQLTSRELHEALVEYTMSARGSQIDTEHQSWRRSRERSWGKQLNASRARAERIDPQPSSPLQRLIAAAAPGRKWSLSRASQAKATAIMQGAPPMPIWAAAAHAGAASGCADELNAAMTGKSTTRLSPNATVAASAVVRRLSLMATTLGQDIVRAQLIALRTNGCSAKVNLSICTGCCSLCTSPKGDAPIPPGMRVNLENGNMICNRCDTGAGLIITNIVGKIITFATPQVLLVHVVVCASCGVVTTVRADGYWGTFPVCSGCYDRCLAGIIEAQACFCGKLVQGTAMQFPARSDAGEDIVLAACYRHEQLAFAGARQSITDLQLLCA